MVSSRDPISEIKRLRENPSVLDWKIELRAILYGDRNHEIDQCGTVPDYIESILGPSKDMALSDTLFYEALRQLVEEWNPVDEKVQNENLIMLEILGTYPFAAAISKVLNIVAMVDEQSDIPGELSSNFVDMKNCALLVLENFFLMVPAFAESNSPTYSMYIGVLRKCIGQIQYSAHAASRLLMLRAIKVDDLDIKKAIIYYPEEVLGNILNVILKRNSKNNVISDIRSLYSHCLSAGDRFVLAFQEVLEKFGAKLKYIDFSEGLDARRMQFDPSITFMWSGEEISVSLLYERNYQLYYNKNFDIQELLMSKKLEEIRKSNDKDEPPQ